MGSVELDDLASYLATTRDKISAALDAALPVRHPDAGRLIESMRFSLLLPGKRLRGVVCLAVTEAFGGRDKEGLALAIAVEMVHAASLILDDLPAFDDARLRRGQPTNHLRFGQATATLASVALLNAAFRHLAQQLPPRWLGPDAASGSCVALADAVGENGMIAGEALDLLARGQRLGLDEMERIHALKTGSLFIACAVEAARLAGGGAAELAALRAYAKNLGLAFQITDDLLDVVGDPHKTGKLNTTAEMSPSFVSLAGVDGARQIVSELIETSIKSLSALGKRGDRLVQIARLVERRDR